MYSPYAAGLENSPYHTQATRAGYTRGITIAYRPDEPPPTRLPAVPRSPRMPAAFPSTRALAKTNREQVEKERKMGYHERRFGWQAGFWTMWDTEPTGTKNCIARHEVVDRTSSTPRVVPSLRDAGWDRDPSGLQMTPASGTCGTSIRPHECWDNRGSASWRKTIKDEEKALLKPAKGVKQRTPRSARQPRPPPAKALPKVQFRNTTREIP